MFVSKIRAESDDRSPWGNFWFEPIATRTITGARVSNDRALQLSAVYAAVRVLAETFAVLPFVLYRKKAGGGKIIVTDHWLNKLFNKRPNVYQNCFEWREMMQGHLALRGNAFNRIIAGRQGEIEQLIPIHPDRIKIQMLTAGNYRYQVMNPDGTYEYLARGEVWHIRGLSSDGLIGLNPIEIARETMGMALSAQEYGARFFANDAKPTGGWIEMQGSFSNNDARKTFRDSWQAAQAGMNRGKLPILESGMKYHEVGATNKDSQFLEVRGFQIAEIARIFRVPPHLIGDLSRSTNNNIEQQSLEFVTYTMTPWAERWEASIEADLLLDDDDVEVEFDFTGLMRGDSAARAEYYSSGINSGWLTRNEARIAENLDPIEGLDEPLQPLNMVEAGETPPPSTGNSVPAPSNDDAAGESEEANSRLAALATSAAERVARREFNIVTEALGEKDWSQTVKEAYEKHVRFVADVLHVDIAVAAAYCAERCAAPIRIDSREVFEAEAVPKLTQLALKGKS